MRRYGWMVAVVLLNLPTSAQQLLWLKLSAEAGMLFNWTDAEFLRYYRQYALLPELPTDFPIGEWGGISVRIPIDSTLLLRLSSGLARVRLDHFARQPSEDPLRGGERLIRTLLETRLLPVWVGPEWLPLPGQFATTVHVGVGIVPSFVLWQEEIRSSIPQDTRRGGVYIRRWYLRWGVRAAVGTVLGFDVARRGALLESLRVEASGAYVPLRSPLLAPLSAQLPMPAEIASSSYALTNVLLILTFALTLQLPVQVY